jgi:putative ABC transport system permease protein
MRFLRMLLMRVRALVRGDAVDRELGEEIGAHLDRLVEEHMARGVPAGEARALALREFGPVSRIVEDARAARGITWIAQPWQDVRYGARLMRRSPGFAVAAVLTIAVGIGATTAMFSVVYGVVLQPLPYRQPGRLVNLWTSAMTRGLPRTFVGMANVYDWRSRNHVFEDIGAMRPVANFNLTGEGEPERLNGARVSANLFPVLGVTPLHGRLFTEDEDEIGHERVAILTHALWRHRFHGDPFVVGKTILLSGTPFTVVGVMRHDFAFPSREFQIYVPLTFNPQELVNRMSYSYLAVARLKPGVSIQQAQVEMTAISSALEREYPRENAGIATIVSPMLDDTVAAMRTPLYVLLGAVAAMLLIGCVNLANLLVARAMVRQRELAMRAALGAARARLVMQSIGELVPMLIIGGLLGLVGAAWVIDTLVPLLPDDVPRVENIALHVPVLIATAATLAVIAVFVGMWPALNASRRGFGTSVADLSRGNTGAPLRTRMRDGLVVAQIAATLWLVVAASLLLRSFAELLRVHPGFNPQNVYSLHLAIARSKYPADPDVAAYVDRILERVQALPDVVAAGVVNRLPLTGRPATGPIEFEGIDPQTLTVGNVDYRPASPDYFRTMQIPIVAGRTFGDRDTADALPVVIIDERLAATVLGGVDPLGRRVRIPGNASWLTVIGVAGHIRHERLEEDTRPQLYFPYTQWTQDRVAMVVRTRTNPAAIAASVGAVIRQVDPEQPIYDARTLDEVVDRSLAQRWLQSVLLGSLAALGLILATIGVYGVTSYAVGQRRREFGVRLALGARAAQVVGLVMRRGALLCTCGAAIGVLAAAATAQMLSGLLFSISAFDVVSFSVSTIVLLSISLVACAVPAIRAASIDPTDSLRE